MKKNKTINCSEVKMGDTFRLTSTFYRDIIWQMIDDGCSVVVESNNIGHPVGTNVKIEGFTVELIEKQKSGHQLTKIFK